MYFMKHLYKKIMPRSLFGRSLLIIVLPILLTMTIATVVFFDRHWSTTTERLMNSLAGEITSVIYEIKNRPEGSTIDYIAERAQKNFDFRVKEISKKAVHLNSWVPKFSIVSKLSNAIDQRISYPISVWPKKYNNRDFIYVAIEIDNQVFLFEIPEKRIFSSTTYIFLLAMIGGGFFLMAIAIIFMRNQVRPVRRLVIAAEKLGKGEDVNRFKPEGAREVRQAANAFLVMRERIKRQVRQRTDMLAGVSHDLRTPLTRLKLQLALLGESEDIKAMKEDIAAMEHMIDGYLAFARGDDEEETIAVQIHDLLNSCVVDAKRRGQTIEFNKTNAVHHIRVRENAIRRLLDNLIANAGKYASKSWISINTLPNALEIWIEDDGPGIPEEKFDDVFKPFFRLDESRNIDEGGVGLGLSIARDIAISHGGDIRLEKSDYGGLKAVVRLPL